MGGKFLDFIKYNNAVSIGVALLFLSCSGALAASPEVRADVSNAVLSTQQTIKSVDNSYIVNVDLSTYAPKIQITGVTEDNDNYYVAYKLTTIDLKEYVWQQVAELNSITVPKNVLAGQDLGLYVTRQLKDVMNWQLSYLQRVQDIERKSGVSQAVVATVYGGLVGKFLDSKESILPGYVPVVAQPATIVPDDGGSATGVSGTPGVSPSSGGIAGDGVATTVTGKGGDSIAPTIQILGKNPAQIPVGSTYMDLGAFVTDNITRDVNYSTQGTGSIDTSKPGQFTITYTAVDHAGNTSVAKRTVIVYDPLKGPPIDPSTIPIAVPVLPTVAVPETPADTSTPATTPIVPQADNISSSSSTPDSVVPTAPPDTSSPATTSTDTSPTTDAITPADPSAPTDVSPVAPADSSSTPPVDAAQ